MYEQKEIWFDGREISLDRQDIWSLINNSPIRKVVFTLDQRLNGHYPNKTIPITEIRQNDDLQHLTTGDIVLSDDQGLLVNAASLGYQTCLFCNIQNRQALDQSIEDIKQFNYAIIDFDLPTNIPLELIIARLPDRKTVLVRRVANSEEIAVAFGVLEHGSDGVLFTGTDIADIHNTIQQLLSNDSKQIVLQPVVVTGIEHVGMGMRSCIDTTGLMTQDEGMIVGSTSVGGFFICSETHYLPYMNLRPFRVNAGAVHSYIWMPGNTAEYLTDLQAGSAVLCVDTQGKSRELTIGRIKTESRPLLLIQGEAAGCQVNVIVQDDWHIRLMSADGLPRNATTIQIGDQLLGHICKPGRHVGIQVNETILEK